MRNRSDARTPNFPTNTHVFVVAPKLRFRDGRRVRAFRMTRFVRTTARRRGITTVRDFSEKSSYFFVSDTRISSVNNTNSLRAHLVIFVRRRLIVRVALITCASERDEVQTTCYYFIYKRSRAYTHTHTRAQARFVVIMAKKHGRTRGVRASDSRAFNAHQQSP